MGSELNKALASVQANLPGIAKGETAEVKNKDTGKLQYTYQYADLADVSEAILPLLGKNGLAFTAWPTLDDDGKFALTYALIHESGEERAGTYPLPASGTPQQIGSAITYARRYCLCAVTGVAPGGEDNDAAGATEVHMDRARTHARPPSDVPSRPVSPGPRPGPGHEQLRHGTVEATPGDHPADHGPLPEDQNPWQDVPAEELPGSATPAQVRDIQMTYQKLGFKRAERAQAIAASEQIIRRHLTGPNDGRTHNNLSYTEAVKLKDTVGGFKNREDMVARMVQAVSASHAATAQQAAEATQEAGDG